jgi:beta-glucosidase
MMKKQLNVNSHRFSIEWSRIQPKMNEYSKVEIEHYHEVIDELLRNNIQPIVTIHHFTNPSKIIYSKIKSLVSTNRFL